MKRYKGAFGAVALHEAARGDLVMYKDVKQLIIERDAFYDRTVQAEERVEELEQYLLEVKAAAGRCEEENDSLRAQLQTSYEQEMNSTGRTALRNARDKWMNRAIVAEKDATRMFAALEQSGSSNRLPDDLIERWKKK